MCSLISMNSKKIIIKFEIDKEIYACKAQLSLILRQTLVLCPSTGRMRTEKQVIFTLKHSLTFFRNFVLGPIFWYTLYLIHNLFASRISKIIKIIFRLVTIASQRSTAKYRVYQKIGPKANFSRHIQLANLCKKLWYQKSTKRLLD